MSDARSRLMEIIFDAKVGDHTCFVTVSPYLPRSTLRSLLLFVTDSRCRCQ